MGRGSGRRSRNRLALLVVATPIALWSVTGAGGAFSAQDGPFPPPPTPLADLPPAKAQVWQRMNQEVAAARANPRPKSSVPAFQPVTQQPDPRQAGIDTTMHQGPFSVTEFTVRDSWQGPVGADWVLVYAGATTGIAGPAGQGALRLYSEPTDAYGAYHLVPLGTYQAPAGDAALTVAGANGSVLSLRTDSGSTLSFNLQTHHYQ